MQDQISAMPLGLGYDIDLMHNRSYLYSLFMVT